VDRPPRPPRGSHQTSQRRQDDPFSGAKDSTLDQTSIELSIIRLIRVQLMLGLGNAWSSICFQKRPQCSNHLLQPRARLASRPQILFRQKLDCLLAAV